MPIVETGKAYYWNYTCAKFYCLHEN